MPFDVDLAVKIAVPLGALVLGKYLDGWLTKQYPVRLPKHERQILTEQTCAASFKLPPDILHHHSVNAG
jgi:hypothetical protein